MESGGPTITNCIIDGQPVSPQQRQAVAPVTPMQSHQLFFSYEEIQSATENFNEKLTLGSGSYGTVFKVARFNFYSVNSQGMINGTAVAIKVIKVTQKPGGKKGFEHEIQLLSTFRYFDFLLPLDSCSDTEIWYR